jgi:hypothetical protein
MDLGRVKQRYARRLCPVGNVDNKYVMTSGTIADVDCAVGDAP